MHKILLILFSVLMWCAEASAQSVEARYDHFFLEAVMEREKGNDDAAFDLFMHCIDIDPTKPEAYYFLGKLYTNLKEKEKALGCFEKAAELNPDNDIYLETLAYSYVQSARIEDATAILA